MKQIIGLIDWFIRPEFKQNKNIFQKARLLVATHFITIIYAILHIVIFSYIHYNYAVFALSIISISTFIGLFLYKKFVSIIYATNSIIFWAFLGFLIFIYSSGGIYSPTLSWLVPVSLIGFLNANRISGLIWSSLSILTIITFFILNNLNIEFPILLNVKWLSLHNTIAFSGSSMFVLIIVFIYDAINRQRTEELELFNQKLIESEISLRKSFEIVKQKENDLQIINNQLKEKTEELFQQKEEIITQKEEIESQRDEIYLQKSEIEKKNTSLTDSIHYALRIQEAMLPTNEMIACSLPEHFILYKPRDIVSGDFYWFRQIKNYTFIAAADCTGHGVPGAFMSMLGISILNEIITRRDLNPPNEVLDELRKRIKKSLHQKGQDGQTQDGMDIAMCVIDNETNEIQYSGAFNPLYIFRKNVDENTYEFIENKADRMPIGVHPFDNKGFTTKSLTLQLNDTIYLFSDGYVSQFGGEKSEKFKSRRLKNILSQIQDKDLQEQKLILEKSFIQWQGDNEQVDDILLIGIRIK